MCRSLLERIESYEGFVSWFFLSPCFANGMRCFRPCYLEPLWVGKENWIDKNLSRSEKQLNSQSALKCSTEYKDGFHKFTFVDNRKNLKDWNWKRKGLYGGLAGILTLIWRIRSCSGTHQLISHLQSICLTVNKKAFN